MDTYGKKLDAAPPVGKECRYKTVRNSSIEPGTGLDGPSYQE